MKNIPTIIEALIFLRPGAKWGMANKDYSTLEWFEEDQEPPTLEELENEIVRLQNQMELDEKLQEATKQSALNKLMALGLTEEEALALGK